MHLRQRVEEILAGPLSETQLLGHLTQLILEYDCDRDFYAGPALNIPPKGQQPEGRTAVEELKLIYE